MAAARGTRLRARVVRELPEVVTALHNWKRARSLHGHAAVEATVNRARWPEGPTKLRFFEDHGSGDLCCESLAGGRVKYVIVDASEPGAFWTSCLFPIGRPEMN